MAWCEDGELGLGFLEGFAARIMGGKSLETLRLNHGIVRCMARKLSDLPANRHVRESTSPCSRRRRNMEWRWPPHHGLALTVDTPEVFFS